MKKALLAAVALLALSWAGAAFAQSAWAVQTVALRDYVEAQSAVNQLANLGFPAYTEFAMDRGRQFVRVRVGCYDTREAADAMAQALRGHVTAEAQAVELTPGALSPGCVSESIGFLNGYGWRLVSDAGPVSFEVLVAGVPATVVHDGERWRMVQDGGELPPLSAATPDGRYVSASVGGSAFAVLETAGARYVVCPGALLAQAGDAAIVERGDTVVACRWNGGMP